MPEKATSHQLSVFSRAVRLLFFETILSNSIHKSIVGGSLLPNQENRTSNAEKYNSWLKPFLRVHFA
ncbi:hypothetical protein [Pseudoalteromonas gelatinilytica]